MNENAIRDLREQRKKNNEDAKLILEKATTEKRELSAEERQSIDRIYAAMDTLKADIDRHERALADEKDINASLGRKAKDEARKAEPKEAEQRALAAKAWALGGTPALITDEMRAAAEHFGINPAGPTIESRALSFGTNSAGGYAVQNERMGSLYEFMKWFGQVRSVSNVIETQTGASFPIPTVTDTANSAAITSEAGTIASNVDPTFAQTTLSAYKYVSPIVLVSIELLRDATFDVNAYLVKALGRRLARKQNTDFTTGNGTNAPQGVITGAGAATAAAATNALTFDDIINFQHSIDIAYRQGAVFMAHDDIIKAVRKLKDSQNRYLWEPSTTVGAPDVLLGQPLMPNNDMASALTTGQKVMLTGNLGEAFLIRDVGQAQFQRQDALYWATQQVGFLAFQFSDSKVLDNTAIKYLPLA